MFLSCWEGSRRCGVAPGEVVGFALTHFCGFWPAEKQGEWRQGREGAVLSGLKMVEDLRECACLRGGFALLRWAVPTG